MCFKPLSAPLVEALRKGTLTIEQCGSAVQEVYRQFLTASRNEEPTGEGLEPSAADASVARQKLEELLRDLEESGVLPKV